MIKITIKNIGIEHINELKSFFLKAGDSLDTFRYFKTRPYSTINYHLVTALAFRDNCFPIGYGHLDPENMKVWLGLCVMEKWKGKGIGKRLMNHLIEEAERLGLPKLYLSVDKENNSAIKLYKQFNFKPIEKRDKILIFKRDLYCLSQK